jgi:dTDP-L-rhamnose 4-epimerase
VRALVTGGAGFIGSHTADALLGAGFSVRAIDSLEPPVHPERRPPEWLDPRIDLRVADVRDADAFLDALRDVDVVYHLAAFQDYLPVFSRYFDVNATSTALLYELIVRERLPVKKVVVASSQATLGEGLYRDAAGRELMPDIRPDAQLARGEWEVRPPPGYEAPLAWRPTDESRSNPQNQYAVSKIAEETIALSLGKRYGIPTVAMRYSIVQGPRQSFHNAYSGACRVFCLAMHRGVEPPIYEDGRQVRDFVNVEDVVDANLLVLRDDRADFGVFHVGGDRAVTVLEFARIVADVFERRDYEPRSSGRYRFGDTRHVFSDVSRLRSLGWSPRRSVRQSVEAYRDWLESRRGDVPDVLGRADREMVELGVVRSVRS